MKLTTFCVILCITLFSCQNLQQKPVARAEVIPEIPPESVTPALSLEAYLTTETPWPALKLELHKLPSATSHHLSKSFMSDLESFIVYDKSGPEVAEKLLDQLRETLAFPIIPGFALPLKYNSRYDNKLLNFTLLAPETIEDDQPLVIVLDSYDSFPQPLHTVNAWKLYIPSRPHLNYQLVSEGDFWQMLESAFEVYPRLKEKKTFLIGNNYASDAALFIANSYPYYFSGIAFSGGKLGLDLSNLDSMPMISYQSAKGSNTSAWGGEKLIEQMRARGNQDASSWQQDARETLRRLIDMERHNQDLSFKFFDYQYAHLTPFLTVQSKISDQDPAVINLKTEDGTLVIHSENIERLTLSALDKHMEKEGVTALRYNDKTIAYQSQLENTLTLGGEEQIWTPQRRKVDAPGAFINFYRNEPLYIIYQDHSASPEYLSASYDFAKKLASLQLRGLPKIDLSLPLIPLSQYSPEKLPEHRIMAIGEHRLMKELLESAPGYFPLSWSEKDLIVNQRFRKEPFPELHDLIYTLTYPPEEHTPLKLAMLFAADSTAGIHFLDSKYSSATVIFDQSDLKIWSKSDDSYNRIVEETFDAYWDSPQPSNLITELPPHNRNVWEIFLQDKLAEKSHIHAMVLPQQLTEGFNQPPQRLSLQSLKNFIPNKYFAVVTLSGDKASYLGNKILDAFDNPSLIALDKVLSFNNSLNTMRFDSEKLEKNQQVSFLVPVDSLNTYSPRELEFLDYRIYPHSLHEILITDIADQEENFARELMQLSNEFSTY